MCQERIMCMKHLYTVAALVIFASCLEPAWSQLGKGCLTYEPTVVRITGTIIERTFPGPPNYESIKDGDEPETYWPLVLRGPVCVDQGDPGDLINEGKKGIRRIQLVLHDEGAYDKYHRLLGKRVVATGTLYGSHTAHHKTDR